MAKDGGREKEKSSEIAMDPATFSSFEDVLEMVGTKGAHNILVLVSCALVSFMTPMQILSAGFLGKTPDYWCRVDQLIDANWTQEQIRSFATPQNQTCEMINYDYSVAASLDYETVMQRPSLVPGGNATVACDARYFEPGVHSIVTEWDLVCDRLVWYSTTVAAAQFGLFIGSLLFGYLLDSIGRRLVMMIGIFLFIPCGLLVAASVNVFMYAFFRVAVTMFGFGIYLGAFVLSMELCTPSQRSLVSSYFVLPWAFGYMATAVFAYAVQYWRYLQVALTMPAVLLICNYFIVPESPRWLVQQGRYEESLKVLKKMAVKNNREMPSDTQMLEALRRICPQAEKNNEQLSCSSWLRKWILPQVQWKIPVIFYTWFAVSMVYYGVSQGASNLGLDEYVFIFVGGALEAVSYIAIYPAIRYLGRRNSLVFTFVFAAVSILGVMGMQLNGYDGDNGGLAFLSYSGKFMITAAFQLVYIVTGELFPTTLRSLVIGESSVCARIGSISSPYINIQMGRTHKWAPSAFFGICSILAGGLCLLLPETSNVALDDSGDSGEDSAKPMAPSAAAATGGVVNQSFELPDTSAKSRT